MPDEDLNRILSTEPAIRPSPMFTAKIMRQVEREAKAPPPIAFPWKRAVPGLAAFVVGLVWIALAAPASVVQVPAGWMEAARHLGLGWVALALAAAGASTAVTRQLTSR